MTKTQAQKAPEKKMDDHLVEELSKHYGVEFTGDRDKFIKDLVRESKERTKSAQHKTNIDEAAFESKIGQLRLIWVDGKPERSETPQQKGLRKALKDADITATLEFPDDNTWHAVSGGKEDSGSMTMSQEAIIGVINRMANPEELT